MDALDAQILDWEAAHRTRPKVQHSPPQPSSASVASPGTCDCCGSSTRPTRLSMIR